MADLSYLNKPSHVLILDLINNDNRREFLSGDVTVTNPRPSGRGDRNSQATLVPAEGSLYYGSVEVFYNRLDLDAVLTNNEDSGLVLTVPNDGFLDSGEICDRLNAMFGLQLTDEDVIVEPIDLSTVPVEYDFKANPSSLAWVGVKRILIVVGRPLWEYTFDGQEAAGFELPVY